MVRAGDDPSTSLAFRRLPVARRASQRKRSSKKRPKSQKVAPLPCPLSLSPHVCDYIRSVTTRLLRSPIETATVREEHLPRFAVRPSAADEGTHSTTTVHCGQGAIIWCEGRSRGSPDKVLALQRPSRWSCSILWCLEVLGAHGEGFREKLPQPHFWPRSQRPQVQSFDSLGPPRCCHRLALMLVQKERIQH